MIGGAYVNTYMHTYIHTYIHTHIQTYRHANLENRGLEEVWKFFKTDAKLVPQIHENQGLERVWEVLETILAWKFSWRPYWPLLASLASTKLSGKWPKMVQVGTKLAPRSAQLGSLGSHLDDFGRSWGRSLHKWPKCKNEPHYGALAKKWGLVGGF